MARLNRDVPGPHRWSPFGVLSEVQRDPLGTFLRGRESYGDVVKFRVGMWNSYLLSHPDDIKRVLQDNNQNYRKGLIYQYLKPVLGLGLLTNEGESWLSQRRLAQPAFHRQELGELTSIMTGAIGAMLDRWRNQTEVAPRDIAAEMAHLTMDMVGQALLGSDLAGTSAQVHDAVKVGQEHVNWRITHPFSLSENYPTPRNRRFTKALRTLDDLVYSIIEQRRHSSSAVLSGAKGGASGHDLLTLLLEARDEDTGEGMTDWQLRNEVITIFLAGHETTANALAWAWHLLSLHPEVEEQIYTEVDSVLCGRLPTLQDITRLTYTRMVLDETLRLCPPAWVIARFPVADDEASGYRIPAYSQVILSSYVTHRHPDLWQEPERFDPERFQPDQAVQRPRYAYFPFGGGPRMCIGSEFAVMEGVLALATVAREYRLRALPGHKVEPEALITLRPRGGLPMFVERRQ